MNRAYDHRHYQCLMTIGIRIYLSQQFSLLIHEVTLVLTSRNKGHYHSTLSPVCLFSIISCWFYWFWNITGSVNYESFELWKISSGKNNLVLVFTDISYSKLTKSMWFCQSSSSSFITVIIFIEITTILTKKKYFDTGVDRPWRPIFCRWRESLSQDCLDRYHGMLGEGKIFISIINNQ